MNDLMGSFLPFDGDTSVILIKISHLGVWSFAARMVEWIAELLHERMIDGKRHGEFGLGFGFGARSSSLGSTVWTLQPWSVALINGRW